MKIISKKKFPLIVTVSVLLVFGCGKQEPNTEVSVRAETPVERTTEVKLSDAGYPEAPDFVLTDLSGKAVQLSDFDGRMIILNFWATWCGPCRDEIPFFVEMVKKHKDEGLTIIGVSMDMVGADAIKSFTDRYNVNYPILLNDNQVNYTYGGIQAIPTTFIINKNGKVVNRFIGNPGEEAFKNEIKKWLHRT